MRTAVEAETEKAVAEGKAAPKPKKMAITYNEGNGVVRDFDKAGMKLSKKQRAGYAVAKILHKLGLGTNFEFFESFESKTKKVKNQKGKLVPARVFINDAGVEEAAPAGVYMKSDGTIRIDLNAYNGRGLTLYALSHELTHFIQQWSTEKYEVLAEYLVSTYEKTGMTMHQRVLREQARLKGIRGEDISYNEAYDEVVANAMMKMFDDGKLVERLTELKAKDKNLAMKLWEGFKEILNKLLGVYQSDPGVFNDTKDLMQMKEDFETLQGMFAEALVEASENFQANLSAVEVGVEPVVEDQTIQEHSGKQHSSQETDLDTETDSAYDGGKKKTEQEVNGNERREESREAFLGRAGKTLPEVEERGALTFGCRRYSGQLSKNIREAEEGLNELGIPVVAFEELEGNKNGITTIYRNDALAIPGVAVFIRYDATVEALEIVGHEGYHYLAISDNRNDYDEVLTANINFASTEFINYQKKYVGDIYFDGDVVVGSKEWATLMEEIFAYITGDIHNGDPKGEVHKFLRDYDAVKAAWDDLIKKQATDTRYSSQETDRDYIDAVNRGDMETVQKMVYEAAKAAGYPVKVYHGTQKFGFTKIDTKKSDDGISFFAADDLAVAGSYANIIDPDARGINEKKGSISRKTVQKLQNQVKAIASEYLQKYTEVLGYYDHWHMDHLESTKKAEWVKTQSQLPVFTAKAINAIALIHDGMMDAIDKSQTSTKKYPAISVETRQKLGDLKNEYTKKVSGVISPYQDTGVYGLYANTDNHLVIDAQGGWWNDIKSDQLPAKDGAWKTRDVAKYAKENGYSGVTFKNLIDPANRTVRHPATVYVFFDPKTQLKSADPVTYTKLGRVIPLSKRFNAENKDIRYSSQETDADVPDSISVNDVVTMGNGRLAVNINSKESGLVAHKKGEWPAVIAMQIRATLAGKSIYAADGDIITITNRGAREIAYGTDSKNLRKEAKETGDYSEVERKMFTAEHAASIIALSTYKSWSANTEDPTDGFKRDGLNHRDVNLYIDGELYTATVLTALSLNETDVFSYGEKFYDIVSIEKQTNQSATSGDTNMAPIPHKIRFADDSSDRLTIAQKQRFVNRQNAAYSTGDTDTKTTMAEAFSRAKELRSTQETDNISNRDMLANAFETLAQNSEEYRMIQRYKGHIRLLNEYEEKLSKLNAEIREITFGKDVGRDYKRLRELQAKAKETAGHINRHDKKLLSLEASRPFCFLRRRQE